MGDINEATLSVPEQWLRDHGTAEELPDKVWCAVGAVGLVHHHRNLETLLFDLHAQAISLFEVVLLYTNFTRKKRHKGKKRKNQGEQRNGEQVV